MRSSCALSCNLCGQAAAATNVAASSTPAPVAPATSAPVSSAACTDSYGTATCAQYLAQCGNPAWADFMRSSCALSCNLCGQAAAATTPVPKVNTPAPVAPTLVAEVCEKDKLCFDAVYTCISCCGTGLSLQGATCWDASFSRERCCAPAPTAGPRAPPTSAPMSSTLAPVQPSATCARDAQCFSNSYPCEICCDTDKNSQGVPCFDSVFTKSRCCWPKTSAPTSTSLQASSTIATATPTGAASQSCAKDGYCFDATFTCPMCCSTGVGLNAKECWIGGFTKERCCDSRYVPQAFTPPTPTSAPIAAVLVSGICVRDAKCFDGVFVCEGCCKDNKNTMGGACWDQTFTKQRCCA